MEAIMATHEQIELPVRHIFSAGVYARELFIPKGVMLTGKIHRFECLNVMAYGKMRVFSDNGEEEPFILEGYNIMTSPPGLKRIGEALEDTLWTTFHSTDETDLDKLEELLTMPDENTELLKRARALSCQ
jgi:hypothetical protein